MKSRLLLTSLILLTAISGIVGSFPSLALGTKLIFLTVSIGALVCSLITLAIVFIRKISKESKRG
jgi:hypothetical protein